MRIGKWARLILMAAPLLAGCKGFWNAPPTTPGTGSTGGVFYVLNQTGNKIGAFSIVSGTVTAVTGSPNTLNALPFAIAVAPGGGYLYVSTASGIFLYNIGTGGALTLGNSAGLFSADAAFSMQVDPTGTWLLEAVSGVGTLNAIPILTATGLKDSTRNEYSVTLGATTLNQLAISPANSANTYVFVAMGSGGTAVVPFTAGNANPFGTVSNIAVKNTAAGADLAVAVDTSNRLLFVGETVAFTGTQTGGLRVFPIGATIGPEVSTTSYSTGGTGPSAILPTADYVYVANKAVSGSTSGNISGFAITATGSVFSLTAVSTVAAGNGTIGLAEDSTSTFVLAVNSGGSPDLSVYKFDTTTAGKLVASTTSATGTDPTQAVAIAALKK